MSFSTMSSSPAKIPDHCLLLHPSNEHRLSSSLPLPITISVPTPLANAPIFFPPQIDQLPDLLCQDWRFYNLWTQICYLDSNNTMVAFTLSKEFYNYISQFKNPDQFFNLPPPVITIPSSTTGNATSDMVTGVLHTTSTIFSTVTSLMSHTNSAPVFTSFSS